MKTLVHIALLALCSSVKSMILTPETWGDLSVDKTLFVRFVSPTCNHCGRMQSDWDTLKEEFKDSTLVVVAQIDCGGSHKTFCKERGVSSFPTVKHGHVGHLEEYRGSHDISGLRRFVSKLRRPCNPDTLEGCQMHQVREIKRLSAMSDKQVEGYIQHVKVRTHELEADLVLQKSRLHDEYNEVVRKHKDAIDKLHEYGDFAMHNIVMHHRRNKEL